MHSAPGERVVGEGAGDRSRTGAVAVSRQRGDAGAGVAESAEQRDQVHAAGRQDRGADGGNRTDGNGFSCGQRHRHERRGAGAGV